MVWKRILIAFDSIVGGLHISCFEWRLANNQRINDNSQGPNIDFVGVASSTFEHFRSDIVGCTANSSFLFAVEIEFGGESEISQLNHHFIVDKQVTQLQVSMDNAVGVEVSQSIDDLQSVALDFELMQSFPSLQQLIHALVVAQLQQNVDVLAIFEEVHELGHVLVLY